MSNASRTWLITGCSTGLGRALAEVLIGRGERVFATARNPADLVSLVAGHPNARALKLDVTVPADITEAVAAVEREGGVDVLVNNAGYGYMAAIEEGEESGYRALFEANVFGLFALTRAVLPAMRGRGKGCIVNVSSIGGMIGNPGSGYYAGTKFAVVGFSEALAKEVGPLGLKVMVVQPGPFRTDWAGRSMQRSSVKIDAYAETAHARFKQLDQLSGKQAGDPRRAANAIITAIDSPDTPVHLILGADGLRRLRQQLASLSDEFDAWEAVTHSADFPDPG